MTQVAAASHPAGSPRTEADRSIGRPSVRRRRRVIGADYVAVAALVVYVVAAYWLRYEYSFAVGDALARTADAKFMVLSRDPHAAAIGLYWMPLPTVVQVPLVWILQLIGRPDFAGPLSTCLWGAGTIMIIGRMARDLGLRTVTALVAALAYAFNPVIVYYAANGMSESAELFFTSLLLWGLLRFISDERLASAVIAAVGLTGLALSKWEAVPEIVVVAIAVCLVGGPGRRQRLREVAMNLVLVVGPALWMVGLWLAYQYVIAGTPFAFLHAGDTTQGGLGGGSTVHTGAELASGDVVGSVRFSGRYVVAFAPVLILFPAALSLHWRRTVQALAVMAIGLALVASTTYLVFKGGTFGNPRYFMPVIPAGVALALLLASRIQQRAVGRRVADVLVLTSLLIAAVTGTLVEQHRNRSVESEDRVFRLLKGEYQPLASAGQFNGDFQALARATDRVLKPGDRVLLDTRFTGFVELFSRKPKQFIITSDRDYELIVAPEGINARFEYAIAPPKEGPTGLPGERDDVYKLIARNPGQWEKVFEAPIGAIYRRSAEGLKGTVEPPRG